MDVVSISKLNKIHRDLRQGLAEGGLLQDKGPGTFGAGVGSVALVPINDFNHKNPILEINGEVYLKEGFYLDEEQYPAFPKNKLFNSIASGSVSKVDLTADARSNVTIAYGNGKFMICTQTKVLLSTDGVSWVENAAPGYPSGYSFPQHLTWTGSVWVLTLKSYAGGGVSVIAKSSNDGASWSTITDANLSPLVSFNLNYPTTGESYTFFTSVNNLAASMKHDASEFLSGSSTISFLAAAFGEGRLVTITPSNQLVTYEASDLWGKTFTDWLRYKGVHRTPNLPTAFIGPRSVAYGNGVFVTGGESAADSKYSPNGIDWFNVPGSRVLGAVVFSNGVFFASGTHEATTRQWVSTNGIDWTDVPGIPHDCYDVSSSTLLSRKKNGIAASDSTVVMINSRAGTSKPAEALYYKFRTTQKMGVPPCNNTNFVHYLRLT